VTSAFLLRTGGWLGNADIQRYAASRGDRTQVRVDDDRRYSVKTERSGQACALFAAHTRGERRAIIGRDRPSRDWWQPLVAVIIPRRTR
jgi:hypothetical protein